MNSPHDIYLASASPRRRELLAQLGVAYSLLRVDVPELRDPAESPEEYVLRVALAKARAGYALLDANEARPVLGADTEVVLDGEVLGKPSGREEAIAMLQRLAGREHLVLSAVAVVGGAREQSRLSVSHVHFRQIGDDEALAYWHTGEPKGKAGGYAIQGRAAIFIQRLEGSYSGVMGLPLYETAQLLMQFGIAPLGQEQK
ncbi:MAG: Maf family nucleotide pyrophosphatase [Gammaproteobacteria bacterium]|nr:Maf family nucleotide pyrophosphatase [Gammaproteobacteria bacterium]